jgi:hypothetical protein
MARSTGMFPRRAHLLDADTVIVGPVNAGTRGRVAETRTGAARLLTTLLNMQMEFRATIYGHTAAAAGGYLLQVAHVPYGGAVADAAGWVTAAVLSADGEGIDEALLSGAAIHKAAKDRATKPLAVTASARAATTGLVTLTVGANHGYLVGDVVTVDGMAAAGAPMNGTYTITAVAATTITYDNSAVGTSAIADGGTAGVVYAGPRKTAPKAEIRVGAVRAIAGTGSNGAAVPSAAGTITLALEPARSI